MLHRRFAQALAPSPWVMQVVLSLPAQSFLLLFCFLEGALHHGTPLHHQGPHARSPSPALPAAGLLLLAMLVLLLLLGAAELQAPLMLLLS